MTALSVLLAVLAGAASASAHTSGTATASLTGTPSPVTAGGTVAYQTTFTNGTSKSLQDTTLDAPAPAGFSVVTVVSAGVCTTSATDATCQFGTLAKGATASATVIMSVPSSPGSVGSSVTWTTSDGDHDDDDLTVTASTTVAVQPPSPDAIAAYVLPAGGNLNTGTTTSPANPQSTGVDVPATPVGAATSLAEVNATGPSDACGPGAKCFGQISVVTVAAPAFSPTDPLHLTFRIDSSELPKHFDADDLKKLPLFHDGVAVPNCTGGPGVASPASCISARKLVRPKHCKKGAFTVEIDVLSTTNGRWRT
ncbi:MAG TPA: hypothetical protein VGI72_08900 [Gaiellales bacterium]